MAKKMKLPPRPAFGSIEQNKIIRAINEGKPNPVTDTAEAIKFYNDVLEDRNELKEKYGEAPIFSLVEPDAFEDAALMSIIPDSLFKDLGIEK